MHVEKDDALPPSGMLKPCTAPGGAATNVPGPPCVPMNSVLAVEDEERVDEIVVRVRIDALEAGLERHHHRRQMSAASALIKWRGCPLELFSRTGQGDGRRGRGAPRRPSGGSKLSNPGFTPRM